MSDKKEKFFKKIEVDGEEKKGKKDVDIPKGKGFPKTKDKCEDKEDDKKEESVSLWENWKLLRETNESCSCQCKSCKDGSCEGCSCENCNCEGCCC